MQPSEHWKVRPHGQLTRIDEDIKTVVGEISMPLTKLPRRMTVVRLQDGRAVVFSAICLDPAGMAALEAFARPAFLVVPNDHHRLDAKAWKVRYPSIQVVAPAGARAKVEKIVHVDTVAPRFDDARVQFMAVWGTNEQESALLVNGATGTTLILNDLVGNIHESSGLGGWFLRRMEFAGREPHIPKPIQWKIVKDRNAVRAQLLQWADIESLTRILVSHGSPIEANPRQALRMLASSLDPAHPAHRHPARAT